MPAIITLSCPSCGSRLQIAPGIEQFACGYCGNEHIVKREGGIVMLAPVVEGLRRVQTGVDKTAAELAIVRLTKELTTLEGQAHRLNSTPISRLYPASRVENILPWCIALFLFMFYVASTVSNTGVSTLSGFGLIWCLVGWVFLMVQRVRSGRRDRAEQLDGLARQIADAAVELRKNQRLVKG